MTPRQIQSRGSSAEQGPLLGLTPPLPAAAWSVVAVLWWEMGTDCGTAHWEVSSTSTMW